MTSVLSLIALVVGVGLGAGLWVLLREAFAAPVFRRTNRRGVELATAGGLVLVLAAALAGGVVALAGAAGWDPDDGAWLDVTATPTPPSSVRIWLGVVVAVLGLGVFGAVDDLAAAERGGGFAAHLGALARGRVTTGMVKLLGGGASALVAVAVVRPDDGVGRLAADAALVALAANLANLFDLVPARTAKVAVVVWAVLVVAVGADAPLAASSLVVGAALALAVPELREQVMVGDTGANALGAALGVGAVATLGSGSRLGVLVALVALNALSEVVSFSRVIEAVPPLRFLDRLGRPG